MDLFPAFLAVVYTMLTAFISFAIVNRYFEDPPIFQFRLFTFTNSWKSRSYSAMDRILAACLTWDVMFQSTLRLPLVVTSLLGSAMIVCQSNTFVALMNNWLSGVNVALANNTDMVAVSLEMTTILIQILLCALTIFAICRRKFSLKVFLQIVICFLELLGYWNSLFHRCHNLSSVVTMYDAFLYVFHVARIVPVIVIVDLVRHGLLTLQRLDNCERFLWSPNAITCAFCRHLFCLRRTHRSVCRNT